MMEKLLSSCKFSSDVLQALCYATVIECRGTGSFVSVGGGDYLDAVVGSCRDNRNGNGNGNGNGKSVIKNKNKNKKVKYPLLQHGEVSTAGSVYVYHSELGWRVGVDNCSLDIEEFNRVVEKNIWISYPIYHACMRIEDLNKEKDILTNVFTRRKFFSDMKDNILTSEEINLPLWILYIDLNNFKVVNDTFGHDMGDRVLRSIAQEMKSVIAGYGVLYRIGGDEFVATLIGVDEQKVHKFSSKIEAVTEQSPCGVFVNASVGIKKYIPEYYGSGDQAIEKLLKEADREMYAMKKNKKQAYISCDDCHYYRDAIKENNIAVSNIAVSN
ncbi:GGDEF domain-containing protein [Thermodesulfovibrionales bacterium]|nr:GGDEF domain-containing protein [Thermodesulfovibrionales bacterium]